MKGSGISWTHNTENFWYGCDKVDEACGMCYDDLWIPRLVNPAPGKRDMKPFGDIYLSSPSAWKEPWAWQREMKQAGAAQRIFTCSLSDFFHAKVDDKRIPFDGRYWQYMAQSAGLPQ